MNELSYARKLWILFWGFFRIAAVVVGGGYAIIPVAEAEFVRKRKFLSEDELVDMMAVIQTVPGILAGNAAIYIGFRTAGIAGAAAALFGAALPSVTIIIAIAYFITDIRLDHLRLVGAFAGAQAAITGLIIVTACRMFTRVVKSGFDLAIAGLSALGIILFELNPALLIVSAALLGIAFLAWKERAE